MHALNQKQIEPYKIFFPISILGGMTGVGVWVLRWISEQNSLSFFSNIYPLKLHISLMTVFFLLPVMKGFVFTAIPRFTGTPFLTSREKSLLAAFQLGLIFVVLFYNDSILFYTVQSLDFVFLFLFILHRFKISKVKLSSYLYFLVGGFFLGFLGSISELISNYLNLYYLFIFGKDMIFYGMIPCIIFGTGTRIIPMIVNSEDPTRRMKWMTQAENQRWTKHTLILYIISFFLEIILIQFNAEYFTKGLRFIICFYWIVNFFHIFELSAFKNKLPRLILVSTYLFTIGLIGHSFGLRYSPHLAHIYLIGGLSLLILGIMTRVTLSHGGGDMSLEKNSNVFYWITGILLFSGFTRAFVYLTPESTASHLAYAAILFIIGLFFWLIKIGRILFKLD